VNFRLVRLEDLSGIRATIYSAILEEDEKTSMTLLDHFVTENKAAHRDEVKDILDRVITIGHTTGARENFFKIHEGVPGDGVCALYDDPNKKLRMYCIRFGSAVLVLGGGGPKSKSIKALQEDEKLTEENQYMRIISAAIAARIKEKGIYWSDDETELLGDFNFKDDE
jgi:hypothetical protein